MIVKEIIDSVTDELQEKGPEIRRKIRTWIYDAEKDMLRQNDFKAVLYTHIPTTLGTDTFVLPAVFGKLPIESPVRINNVAIANINSNVHKTTYWQIIEYIAWASIVTIRSSTNEDSLGDAIKVIPADHYTNLKEILTLNGTTDVDSTNTFAKLYDVYKQKTTGIITVENSDASISFVLPPGAGNYPCKTMVFNTDVSSGSTLEIDFIKRTRKLEDDYEYDELTSAYGDIISHYCLYRGFIGQEDDQMAMKHYAIYEADLKKAIKEDRTQQKISRQYTMQIREQT